MALDLGDDGLRDLALVQRPRAVARQAAQHLGQLRVLQPVADRPGRAVGLVEEGGGRRVLPEVGVGLQHRVQPGADREACLGQTDRRLEQRGPAQPAVLRVCHFQHAHRAGHADRAPAHHRVHEGHRLALGCQEQALVGGGRRGLAAVEGLHALAVPVQQEGAAADAAGLRLHQRQHHLHRDRRIQRRAAPREHLPAGLGGQRIGCGHREPCMPAGGSGSLLAGGDLGLARQAGVGGRGRRRGAGRQQRGGGQQGRGRAAKDHAFSLELRKWPGSGREAGRGRDGGMKSPPPGGAVLPIDQRGARRIAPSRRITSPLSMSLVTICCTSLA